MLREIKNCAQEKNFDGYRRWFTSHGMDLIIWFQKNNEPTGFQLTYDIGYGEHALTWKKDSGYTHNKIDDGEDDITQKMSPILVPDGLFPNIEVKKEFEKKSSNLPLEITQIVTSRI